MREAIAGVKIWKEDLAVRRLEERLRTPLISGMVIQDAQRVLRERLSTALRDRRLKEVLVSDQSQATAKVLDIVWEAAKPRLIGRELVQIFAKDDPSLNIPKHSTPITAKYPVAEGADVPINIGAFTSVTLTPEKSGVAVPISKEMVEDAAWDVIEFQLAEAGRAMAEVETEKIISQMIADAGNSTPAGTTGTLAYDDLVGVLGMIQADNFLQDYIQTGKGYLVVHPDQYADLLKDDKIRDTHVFGGTVAVAPTGRIETILGLNVRVTTKIPSGTALIVDAEHAGALFIRRDITVENYDDPIKDLAGAVLTARWKYATMQPNAIGKVTNC
ncbi:MAG: phage major capsid protein [Candidatus Bathyarchaeia archaeon]